jgi:hypothetical protein
MRHRHARPLAVVAVLLTIVAVAATSASGRAAPGPKPAPTPAKAKAPFYKLANVGPFGGEPTIATDGKGVLYDTTPSGGTLLYKSTNHGASWTKATTADPSSGDDCVFTDQSNAVEPRTSRREARRRRRPSCSHTTTSGVPARSG